MHEQPFLNSLSGLANVCDGGADRLRGIMFDGASGSITHNTVAGVNQGASGCQEGNGVEVRNAPFNGFDCNLNIGDCHPDTQTVEISHNTITDWQKTGIVANGDVDVDIHHNTLSESATQANLAANTIQLGFGALGTVKLNNLEGNQWFGCDLATSNFVASGILVFDADAVTVNENHVTGNSNVGLFVVFADGGLYEKNHLDDEGADAVTTCPYDFGIWDFPGTGNTFNKNHVSGFDTPFDPDPLLGSKNKAL